MAFVAPPLLLWHKPTAQVWQRNIQMTSSKILSIPGILFKATDRSVLFIVVQYGKRE
jgi:hypothetical protein